MEKGGRKAVVVGGGWRARDLACRRGGKHESVRANNLMSFESEGFDDSVVSKLNKVS